WPVPPPPTSTLPQPISTLFPYTTFFRSLLPLRQLARRVLRFRLEQPVGLSHRRSLDGRHARRRLRDARHSRRSLCRPVEGGEKERLDAESQPDLEGH